MNKKNLCLLMFVFSLCLFTACSSDDDSENLVLEKNELVVAAGSTETVKITQGNGDYKLGTNDGAIAKVELSGNEIKVTGVSAGEVTIEITDKEGRKAYLKITVTDFSVEVVGTYKGMLDVTVGPLPTQKIEQDIKVIRLEDNKVKLLIENFIFLDNNVGNIEISGIVLTKDNETVILADTSNDITLYDGGIKGTATVSEASVKATSLAMKIAVTKVEIINEEGVFKPLGMDIAISFEGLKEERAN